MVKDAKKGVKAAKSSKKGRSAVSAIMTQNKISFDTSSTISRNSTPNFKARSQSKLDYSETQKQNFQRAKDESISTFVEPDNREDLFSVLDTIKPSSGENIFKDLCQ